MEGSRQAGRGSPALALWRLSRPEIWMVSILPFYVGWVLGSHQLFPGQAAGLGLANGTTGLRDAAATILGAARPVLLGAVVMGPLLWTATLLINDVYDLPGDRLNARKARSPLVQGLVSRGWANGAAYVFAGLCLAASWPLGWGMRLAVLGNLVLAWAYSVPPVRLKTRPGFDVLTNAIGIGGLSSLGGWSLVQPVSAFPWPFAVQGLLVAAAIYVPTTLVDADTDRRAGYLTLATHLGTRRAYLVGWWLWVAANLGAITLSALDLVLPRAMLVILLVFAPLLLWEYHLFIGRAATEAERVRGVILCSLTFLAVNLVFALLYTGIWRPT